MGRKAKRKKETDISDLLQVACDLTELNVMITLMNEDEDVRDALDIQVKGKGDDPVLLPTLKRCHALIDDIDPDGEIFVPIHDEFDDCIDYLDEKYSVTSKFWKKKQYLKYEYKVN